MNTPEQDFAYFSAGLQELETYLLSKELYWPLAVQSRDFTQLTPGALLLVRARLEGWGTSGLRELMKQMDALRSKWRSAWETKCRREVHARSEMWKDYLEAAAQSSVESSRLYPYQARLRAILALLLDDLREPPSAELITLDARLQSLFRDGAFIWDLKLQSVFPQKEFWFLYGTLKGD